MKVIYKVIDKVIDKVSKFLCIFQTFLLRIWMGKEMHPKPQAII